jgi:hypothetical protein
MPQRILLVTHYRVPATWLSVATMYAAAGYGIWQGIGMLTSGPERFGSPAFMTIRRAPELWGLAALTFGLWVLAGLLSRQFVVKAIGLAGLSLWSLAVATMALTAYLHSPIAAPTAAPTYYFVTVNLGILVWSQQKGSRRAAPPRPSR